MASLSSSTVSIKGAMRQLVSWPTVIVGINPAGEPTPIRVNDDGTLALSAVSLASLPTENPHIAGALWNNNGVLCVSQG